MSDDDIHKKMRAFYKRVAEAKKLNTTLRKDEESTHDEPTEGEKRSARAGSEFLASVFAGGLIGYGIDWFFNTLPWGMIGFIIIGFISGVYRANAAIKASNDKN